MTVIFVGGVSVVGLLQSTERVSSSGIIVQPPPPPPSPPPSPPSPPPEPSIEIDIFSDGACTQPLSSVTWGEIEAGSSVNRIIYIRNSGDEGVTLSLLSDNWSPSGVENYLQLSWDYDGNSLGSGVVLGVTLTLAVSASAAGVDSFSFDIIITGSAI